MTCDFTSFSTVFQSVWEDGRVIMKGCVQWNPIYGWKDFCLQQILNLEPLGQQARGSDQGFNSMKIVNDLLGQGK